MTIQNINNSQSTSSELGANRLTQTRIKIRIPKDLHDEPVISRLISQHGLTVNISAALLSANCRDDGWFDLELRGTKSQIGSALTYLNELDLEIWGQSTAEEDGW
jgi:ABC-type methionine transport system ATPase subunit